jgi:DNA-binding phage protein
MAQLNKHWTDKSTEDFLYRIGADFVGQIERLLGTQSKASLARKLKVSSSRISQVLNNPGNLRLRTMIEYPRALGIKISVVAYDDNDAGNLNGPVDAEIFEQCWLLAGKPRDFFALQTVTPITSDQSIYKFAPQGQQRAAVASGFKQLKERVTETADTSQASGRWRLMDKGGIYGRSDTNSF